MEEHRKITQHRLNMKLHQKLSQLETQMEELKRSYALLSRAEKFSSLGNLVARLAHEIKNPLTAIGTFIQLLPHKMDDEGFREEFYKIGLEATNRVNSLITALLDLDKKRDSHLELNDLHALINQILLLVSPQCKARNIKVDCQFDPGIMPVIMDSEKMKEVLMNLFSNALEHTQEGGEIRILTRMAHDRERREGIRVEISDNGDGIDASIMDKIFDPYFTTKQNSRMHNGTGLGLYIAHKNMQDHGGTIEVKSKVSEGTTFILTLPYRISEE